MSFVVHAHGRPFAMALGFVVPALWVTVAFAQSGGAAPAGGAGATTGGAAAGGAAAGGAAAGGVTTTTGTTSTVVQGPTTFYPGGVAPTPPGQNVGGGNVQYSSSRPVSGPNDRDGFDFQRGGGGGTLRGDPNGSFVLGDTRGYAPNSGLHVVRRGDTLSGICDFYFRNPYQWPRIWSYNPQIQNPHWIYPGDQVRLRPAGEYVAPSGGGGNSLVDRRKQVPPETVFLRNQGYIEDEASNWGEIMGAREDKMILTDFDEVYLRVSSDHDLKVGQELTIYRPVRSVGGGKLIEIQGTVKVDQWNPKERTARARITESLDAIERGARIGPVSRRFEVVPPKRNDVDITASVLTSIYPHNIYGQHQVVFVDAGEQQGLKPGNRLQIIRKGDAWHQSAPSRPRRIALEDDSPAAVEAVPKPRDDSKLPEEIQAELRIISVKKNTSMAVVTSSRREIEVGDKAYARKGY